jgi:methylenetetrahydrofolate reductase (NADPH)
VIPAKGTEQAVLDWVSSGATVTVTASPVKGLEPTVELAERLARRGYRVVPHLAARSVVDDAHLADIVARLTAAGCADVFVSGGDAPRPAGRFDGALPLLERLAEMGRPFAQVGITGYPESHPKIHDDVTIQAMWDKRRVATYIVSNMSFDAETVKRWVERVRRRGVELPIYVGMAGVADPVRLLRVSTKIGVADAARFLRGHPSWVARMFRPGGYEPGRFLGALIDGIAPPDRRVAGLHVFTFNEIEPTERWRREMLSRLA